MSDGYRLIFVNLHVVHAFVAQGTLFGIIETLPGHIELFLTYPGESMLNGDLRMKLSIFHTSEMMYGVKVQIISQPVYSTCTFVHHWWIVCLHKTYNN